MHAQKNRQQYAAEEKNTIPRAGEGRAEIPPWHVLPCGHDQNDRQRMYRKARKSGHEIECGAEKRTDQRADAAARFIIRRSRYAAQKTGKQLYGRKLSAGCRR